jgi:transglutaminase superfamily protein
MRALIPFLEALTLLLDVDLRLRRRGFASVHDALRLPPGAGSAPGPEERQLREARQMARSIRRAARLVPRARCLHRSLALLLWLRRRGMRAELRIGVRHPEPAGGPPGAGVEGHAWVEWGGVPVDDEPAVRDVFGLLEPCAREPR